jgi:hypothetical protein
MGPWKWKWTSGRLEIASSVQSQNFPPSTIKIIRSTVDIPVRSVMYKIYFLWSSGSLWIGAPGLFPPSLYGCYDQRRRLGPGVGGDRSGEKYYRPPNSQNLGGDDILAKVRPCNFLWKKLHVNITRQALFSRSMPTHDRGGGCKLIFSLGRTFVLRNYYIYTIEGDCCILL